MQICTQIKCKPRIGWLCTDSAANANLAKLLQVCPMLSEELAFLHIVSDVPTNIYFIIVMGQLCSAQTSLRTIGMQAS